MKFGDLLGSVYVGDRDQYFDCSTPENTDSDTEPDSDPEHDFDDSVKKREAERNFSVLNKMESIFGKLFRAAKSTPKQTTYKELGKILLNFLAQFMKVISLH